jgi:hypothetical protein
MPVETAPKGTPVMTYRAAGLMAIAEKIPLDAWYGGGWCCTDGNFLLDVTHWMPLPDPPKVTP